MKNKNTDLFLVFASSLSAPFIAYFVNKFYTLQGRWGLFIAGVSCLGLVCFLTHTAINALKTSSKWIYYVFAMGMFSSMIDIFIGLENDDVVSGFMTNYLKSGEPYLTTVHGTAICYYDGICHYSMYIAMLCLIARGKSHWEVGLYWVGSIGHSMIVFIPGNLLGHHSIYPSILLNIPYCIIPLVCGMHFFKMGHKKFPGPTGDDSGNFMSRILKIIFSILFSCAIVVSVFRGFAVLDPERYEISRYYTEHIESYLLHQNAYPKIQVLVYAFYFSPLYIMCLVWLVQPNSVESLFKWVLIMAGASLQAQITHVFASIRMNSNIPNSPQDFYIFWLINTSLLLLPHLFLLWIIPKSPPICLIVVNTVCDDVAKVVNEAAIKNPGGKLINSEDVNENVGKKKKKQNKMR